jgi:hypothetical protein
MSGLQRVIRSPGRRSAAALETQGKSLVSPTHTCCVFIPPLLLVFDESDDEQLEEEFNEIQFEILANHPFLLLQSPHPL